jgi:hypothetical protein
LELHRAYALTHYGAAALNATEGTFLLMGLAKSIGVLQALASDSVTYGHDAAISRILWPLQSWMMARASAQTASLAGWNVPEGDIFRFGVSSAHLGWLSCLSPEEVLELRKHHTIQAIREDFRTSRCRIRQAPGQNLASVIEEAGQFLSERLDQHAKALSAIQEQRKWKLLGGAAATAVGVGLTVGAALYPPLAIPGTLLSVIGGKGVWDFAKLALEERRRLSMATDRPLGVLLRLRDRAEIG